jgi:hypothetical protein
MVQPSALAPKSAIVLNYLLALTTANVADAVNHWDPQPLGRNAASARNEE